MKCSPPASEFKQLLLDQAGMESESTLHMLRGAPGDKPRIAGLGAIVALPVNRIMKKIHRMSPG